MKSYGLTLKGKLYVEKILTLTPWSSNDEGRVVYVLDEDKFYFGTDSEWIEGGGVGSSASNTAGVSTSSGSDGTGDEKTLFTNRFIKR